MRHIMYLYVTAYKNTLEEDIQSDTSGHFCRILVSLVQVNEHLDYVSLSRPPALCSPIVPESKTQPSHMNFQNVKQETSG